MNQQQPIPDGPQMAPDDHQYQQQPQPGIQMQQPRFQSQYAQMPSENTSTPRLDTMYSQQGAPQQYGQPAQQENPGYGQQDFAQQPHVFQDSNNNGQGMEQAPQNFSQQVPVQEHHQQAPFDPSTNHGALQFPHGQPQFQQQAAPLSGYPFEQEEGQSTWPGPQPMNAAPNADASAWEQAHVTEVNPVNAGFRYHPTKPLPPMSQQQQQNQATREAELQNARQRIEALEAEREQQEMAQAIAASARDALDTADTEEQLRQLIHQAQLLSLDTWEQEIRQKIEEHQGGGVYDGGGGSWPKQPLAPPSHLGSNFSDPCGGAALHGPVPAMQNQQNASQISPPNISARGSSANLGFRSPTPRSQPPTRGVPLSDATRNAAAEEAQCWEAYYRGQGAQDGASVSAGTEYSEASTARGGSKGKGRML